MWKKGIVALGMLALVLGGPVFGQEKPKVLGPKPIAVQKADVVVLNGRIQRRDAGLPVWSLDGERVAFVLNGQWIVHRDSSRQPLMFGGLEQAVEKMEQVLEDAPTDDVNAGLAAVDAIEKTVMKARRALREEKFALVEAAVEVVVTASDPRNAGFIVFHRALNPQLTPLQKAWGVAQDDVSLVRLATDVEGVREALEEVEKSLHVLRTLLWEKASKRG